MLDVHIGLPLCHFLPADGDSVALTGRSCSVRGGERGRSRGGGGRHTSAHLHEVIRQYITKQYVTKQYITKRYITKQYITNNT